MFLDCPQYLWIFYRRSTTCAEEPKVWDVNDLKFLKKYSKLWGEIGVPIHGPIWTDDKVYRSDDEAFMDNLLYIATMLADFAMVRLLLHSGANVHTTYKGNRLLHLALFAGGEKDLLNSSKDATGLFYVLLEAGCDPNQRDNEGCTPTDLAKRKDIMQEWISAVDLERFWTIETGRYCESTAMEIDKSVPFDIYQRHRYCSNHDA